MPLLRSLRLRQLSVVVAFVCASTMIALTRFGGGASMAWVAGLGWLLGPFLLQSLLHKLRVAAGLPDTRPFVLHAVGSLFLGFVLIPLMLIYTARDIGRATGEPSLVERVRPLAIGYGVGSLFSGIIAVMIPVVGVVLGPFAQLALLGLCTQMLIQHVVDAAAIPVPRADASTGHAAPVGIRTH